MRKIFMEEDFTATGFHLASYLEKSQSQDAVSLKSRARHTVNWMKEHDVSPHQSVGISRKIKKVNQRLDFLASQ